MSDTQTTQALIQALRSAGHTEVADHLVDRELAGALRERGRDDLAAALEGKAPAPQEPQSQAQADAAVVLGALRESGIIDTDGSDR